MKYVMSKELVNGEEDVPQAIDHVQLTTCDASRGHSDSSRANSTKRPHSLMSEGHHVERILMIPSGHDEVSRSWKLLGSFEVRLECAEQECKAE